MKAFTIRDNNGKEYKRINKKSAIFAYMAGKAIVLSPVNFNPFGPWVIGPTLNKKDRAGYVADDIGVKNDFLNLVNSFEYYNCINSETGRYSAFYIAID